MSAGRRWLVVGSAGMLGHELMARLGDDAAGMDLPDVDITDAASVAAALDVHRPDVVVNAAAWTAVDRAETEEPAALRVNGEGPAVLAAACARRPGTRLLHVSTDYVFAGDAEAPYDEDAEPSPRTAYGRTKLTGERAVLAALPDRAWVLRTAWLYGAHGPNFVSTMLRLEGERETVEVVDDQHGQPTWAGDLAARIVDVVGHEAPPGIYHATNAGRTTWWAFAREVFRLAGADPERVLPVSSAAFAAARSASASVTAPRPAWSVLGHGRWAAAGLAPMRDWREALEAAMPELLAAARRPA